jgi:hypothetical protein
MVDKEVHSTKNKIQELIEEFRSVLGNRGGWADSLVPPLVFILANALAGFEIALWGALGVAFIIGIFRLFKGQQTRYALGGVAGVVVAMIIARLVGGAEGYFLPGIITGGLTTVMCFVSVFARRPLVAFTSYLTRRWPLQWYWHPQVRPAYSEVTLVWGLFFALRTLLQIYLFQQGEAAALGLAQLLLGWPALVLLLIASYLYGLWRLGNLHGPSVDELNSGVAPPWKGQKRGF